MPQLYGVAPAPIGGTAPRWYYESGRSLLLGGVVVLVGGVVLGGLTPLGQQYLPEWLRSLSNSSGGWTGLTFLLVWLSRARPLYAAVLGIVGFEVLVEAYGVVSTWRGHYFATGFTSIWSLVGLAAGPVIGVAASLSRYGRPVWRVLGMAVPAAVLVGEGVWALQTITDTTSPVYWTIQVVVGVLLVVGMCFRMRLSWTATLLCVGVWLAGAATYGAMILLLFAA